jgi:hypothetical protein
MFICGQSHHQHRLHARWNYNAAEEGREEHDACDPNANHQKSSEDLDQRYAHCSTA